MRNGNKAKMKPKKIENTLYVLEWPYADAFHGEARYYFSGPASATQEEFEGLCGRLALDVAKELAKDVKARRREGYCIEKEKFLQKFIGLLERHGYESFATKGILFIDRHIAPDLPHWEYEKLDEELKKKQRTIIKNCGSLDWRINFFLSHMAVGELPWYSDRNKEIKHWEG